MRACKSVALAVFALLLPAATMAQEVVLTTARTTGPIHHNISDQTVDIDGLRTGMAYDAIKATLARPGYSLTVRSSSPVIDYRGTGFRIAEFPVSLIAVSKSAGERIELRFGSPVTGSPVVALRKRKAFPVGNTQTVDAAAAVLVGRYGTPSADTASAKRDARILTWMVPDQGRFVCPVNDKRKAPVCPVRVSLGDGPKGRSAKALQAGIKLGIEAVVSHNEGSDKTSTIVVTIEDFANRQASDEALQAFVHTEGDRRLGPAAAP